MAVEVLSPQNVGGGGEIVELPETAFDDAGRIRRLADGSVVGEAHVGYGSLLRLRPLEQQSNDETSRLRALSALGFLSLDDYRESVGLGDLN